MERVLRIAGAKRHDTEEERVATHENDGAAQSRIRYTPGLDRLPHDCMVRIFSFIGYEGLRCAGLASKRLQAVQMKIGRQGLVSYAEFYRQAMTREKAVRNSHTLMSDPRLLAIRKQLSATKLPWLIASAKRHLDVSQITRDHSGIDTVLKAIILREFGNNLGEMQGKVLECYCLMRKYSEVLSEDRKEYTAFFFDVCNYVDTILFVGTDEVPSVCKVADKILFEHVLDIRLLRKLYFCIYIESDEILFTDVLEPALKALQDGSLSEKQLAQISAVYGLGVDIRTPIDEKLELFCSLIERVSASGSRVERASLIHLFSKVVLYHLGKEQSKVLLSHVQGIKGLRINRPETFAEELVNNKLDSVLEKLEIASSLRRL